MEPGSHSESRVHPTVILAVLSLAGLAYAVLSSAVIPALPTLQHDLHTTETGSAWLLTGFLLSASVGTSIIGRLGDMYGKERLLLWTLLVLAAGTLLAAISNSLALLIVARVIQGVAGGIFPLAFSIARDEFPPDRVAGSIGLMSSILGVGGGAGIIAGALIIEHLDWHWLFVLPTIFTAIAAVCTWRFIPESPIRVPGRVNWLAAALMSIGISAALIAVAQTTTWGWVSAKTIGMFAIGVVFCVAWIYVETHSEVPLIDMKMMRIRGIWTTNLAAFLIGGGMYSSFIVLPQFAQLPTSTGFGFGASVVTSALYLLPAALGMGLLGTVAGRVARRFGSKAALVAGTSVSALAFAVLLVAHSAPIDLLIGASLLGIGIGLAFSALGNLVVMAVPPSQTGAASGMNTVMRTLGGALGGQLSATFIVNNTTNGLPNVTGFELTFAMATAFLLVGVVASLMVPARPGLRVASAREAAIEAAVETAA